MRWNEEEEVGRRCVVDGVVIVGVDGVDGVVVVGVFVFVLRVVLYSLHIVPLRPIHVAEVPVRLALPRPVAHLLCNRQVLRVVLDSLCIVPLRPIRDAQVRVRDGYAMPRCRGSRMPRPPPPGPPPPCPLFGAPCGTRGPWNGIGPCSSLTRISCTLPLAEFHEGTVHVMRPLSTLVALAVARWAPCLKRHLYDWPQNPMPEILSI